MSGMEKLTRPTACDYDRARCQFQAERSGQGLRRRTSGSLRGFSLGASRWGAACRGGSRRGSANRKSTRLNSSHTVISYAVFCLKKKKNTNVLQPITIGRVLRDSNVNPSAEHNRGAADRPPDPL